MNLIYSYNKKFFLFKQYVIHINYLAINYIVIYKLVEVK